MLSDYSLKTINLRGGDLPVNLAWTINTSLDRTTFLNKDCGDFLLSPVTTSVNGYNPASIVTGGFITSTVGNPSSITFTGPGVGGTFDVLLQVTNPSGYYILNDTTKYYATPLFFYVKVVVDCVTGNSITVPTLRDITIDQTYATTTIPAFGDATSGSYVPLACGLRTCTSDNPNVIWDNAHQQFTVQTLGASDVLGTSTVTLNCSLQNYLGVTAAT
jgi:hypothetical protein